MPHGFFTIEQWKPKKRSGASAWAAVVHLNADRSLSDALREIERRDQAGFFRVVQTQRQVWAEKLNGKLRLRKWHVGSPEALARTGDAFVRDKGRWPAKAKYPVAGADRGGGTVITRQHPVARQSVVQPKLNRSSY
jgi:hypothetical protein